jgi:DNA-binding beta-propeller fold protein YncE
MMDSQAASNFFWMNDHSYIRSIAIGRGSEGGVAFDSEGNLVVPNHCIQVLRYSDGALVRTIGENCNGNSEFNTPRGVALDGAGHLVVVERDNHLVQVLNYSDGSHVRFIGGSTGSGNQQLHCLSGGVAIDSDGHIIVSDTHNKRIQKL